MPSRATTRRILLAAGLNAVKGDMSKKAELSHGAARRTAIDSPRGTLRP